LAVQLWLVLRDQTLKRKDLARSTSPVQVPPLIPSRFSSRKQELRYREFFCALLVNFSVHYYVLLLALGQGLVNNVVLGGQLCEASM